MTNSFKFDRQAMERAIKKAAEPQLRDMARKMEQVLSDLRHQHEGKPVSQVKPALRTAFRGRGWDITDPELTRYATAISEGTKSTVQASTR